MLLCLWCQNQHNLHHGNMLPTILQEVLKRFDCGTSQFCFRSFYTYESQNVIGKDLWNGASISDSFSMHRWRIVYITIRIGAVKKWELARPVLLLVIENSLTCIFSSFFTIHAFNSGTFSSGICIFVASRTPSVELYQSTCVCLMVGSRLFADWWLAPSSGGTIFRSDHALAPLGLYLSGHSS